MKPVMSVWQILVLMAWAVAGLVVALLSLVPETSPAVHDVPPAWTNAAHVPAYSLLMAFTILMAARFMCITPVVLWVIVALVSMFGLSIEILQPLVGRSASLLDAGSNIVGACIVAVGYQIWAAGRLVTPRGQASLPGVSTRRCDRE